MAITQRGFATGSWLTVALLLAAGILLLLEASRQSEMKRLRDRTAVLQEDIQAAQTTADAALAAIIPQDVIAEAAKSVYLIVVDGQARGTAFVIDRENGVLATAAHTADSLPLDNPGVETYLINRHSKNRIPVTGKDLHPGFGAFRTEVEDHQPIRKNSSIYAPQAAPLRDLAFDVALLRANAIDDSSRENLLGPDLEIASQEHLLGLGAGSAIAVIGYPYDTLDDGFAADSGTARVERGVIAAMTPPLDTIEETQDPVTANLIIHRLATAGGNSGSPVIDAKGAVIGIHTHGIVSPSSNADGAAQRADTLMDLLSEDRGAARLETVFFPAWRKMLSYWERADAALPWSFYMEYARPDEDPAPSVASLVGAGAEPFTKAIERIEFEDASETRRVLAPDLIGAAAQAGSQVEAGDKSFLIKEPGQYAELWRTVDRRSEHVIFAFDYSLRSRTGFCPLTAYWRKKGDTRLRVARGRASFELHLPPAGDLVEDYQIVLRRHAKCDPLSNKFMAGSVSWASGQNIAAQTVSLTSRGAGETAPPAWRARASQLFANAKLKADRFIECRVKNSKTPDLCRQPEYIDLSPNSGS